MIVRVAPDGAVHLHEPGDVSRLGIAMPDTEAARSALAAVARLDGRDHAWIAPDRLRSLAGPMPPDWDAQFAAMVAYAAGKGWMSPDGSLQVHIIYD